VAAPGNQQALDELHSSIANSRYKQMPCGLGSDCSNMAISPPVTSTACTSSGSKLQLHGMQWTSHFFEVVIVASCNLYLSIPKKKKKKKKKKSDELI